MPRCSALGQPDLFPPAPGRSPMGEEPSRVGPSRVEKTGRRQCQRQLRFLRMDMDKVLDMGRILLDMDWMSAAETASWRGKESCDSSTGSGRTNDERRIGRRWSAGPHSKSIEI